MNTNAHRKNVERRNTCWFILFIFLVLSLCVGVIYYYYCMIGNILVARKLLNNIFSALLEGTWKSTNWLMIFFAFSLCIKFGWCEDNHGFPFKMFCSFIHSFIRIPVFFKQHLKHPCQIKTNNWNKNKTNTQPYWISTFILSTTQYSQKASSPFINTLQMVLSNFMKGGI